MTFALALVPSASTASAPQSRPKAAPCGGPLAPGAIVEPPQIEMASLPLNDLGRHELILRVVRKGDRFCYRYTLAGVEERRAPVLRVHRGEQFAIRLVNELSGPARGATMAASALAPCAPRPMPRMMETFNGYMNHPAIAAPMSVRDVDVNLHVHGFQGPPEEENIFASTLSTPAHACEFTMTIPRTQPVGTYFYHTHAHGMSDDEVSGGLSGMWIVDPDTSQLPLADDHPIVIKYRIPYVATDNFLPSLEPMYVQGLHDDKAAGTGGPVTFDPFNPPPWPSTIPLRDAAGAMARCGTRSGVAFSVDHSDVPGELTVPAGQPQLLRVLNATGDSPLYLRVRDASGAPAGLRVVGRDGTPVGGDDTNPLAQYVSMDEATLPPAGRADVLLTLDPGQSVTLYNAPACQAPADEVTIDRNVLIVRAGAAAGPPTPVVSQPLVPSQSPAAKLVAYARAHGAQVRRRAFTYTEYIVPSGKSLDGAYFITETSAANFREHPYSAVYANNHLPAPDVVVKQGSIEEWDLFNTTLETHSFHIHQMSFVALGDRNGPATLDTVLVPFGKLLPNHKNPTYPLIAPSRTRILLDFRHVPRGTFVFHCHMLFHEDRGMMGVIRVV